MKKVPLLLLLFFCACSLRAQKVDSICFHLYTDSLKKGTHNYINVDGLLAKGLWRPLTAKELRFSSSHGDFEGNDLILPADFKEEKVTIKAVLIENPALVIEKTVWIKKKPDPENLPTREEIMNNNNPKRKKRGS